MLASLRWLTSGCLTKADKDWEHCLFMAAHRPLHYVTTASRFGSGFKFMRRFERPMRIFKPDDLALIGPTGSGIRFTFKDGERWIFGTAFRSEVLRIMADYGVPVTSEVIQARWWPPL